MNITILCSSAQHPVNPWLEAWISKIPPEHSAAIFRTAHDVTSGDFLFLVSCNEIVRKEVRDRFRYTLVLHASNLPEGRGMSPHIWQILDGKREIGLTLLNAEDEVDSGDIWRQIFLHFEGHELYDEINSRLFAAEVELLSWSIENCMTTTPQKQRAGGNFYRRRTPADSRVDPARSIESQFDRLRVCDPQRFPAFFELRGHRYKIVLEKIK